MDRHNEEMSNVMNSEISMGKNKRDDMKPHGRGPEHGKHRRLEVQTDKYGCYHDAGGKWGSHVKINKDGSANVWLDQQCCASTGVGATSAACCGLGNGCCFYECECDDGLMWDADYKHCVSLHWNHVNTEPDVDTIGGYWNTKQTELMSKSVFVKDAAKAKDVLPKVRFYM